jgi:hypothetical protein
VRARRLYQERVKNIYRSYKRRIKQSDAAQIKNTFPENQQRAGKTAFLK